MKPEPTSSGYPEIIKMSTDLFLRRDSTALNDPRNTTGMRKSIRRNNNNNKKQLLCNMQIIKQ
jgi:hypothetical protein